jgi:hypothetical protein
MALMVLRPATCSEQKSLQGFCSERALAKQKTSCDSSTTAGLVSRMITRSSTTPTCVVVSGMLLVRMQFSYTQLTHGVALKVEFDENRALFADNPAVVSRLDCQDLRSYELESATVCVLNADAAAREKTCMCMHAQVSTDDGFDVRGPAEAWRVNDAFHTALADAHDINLNATDFTRLSVGNCGKQWIHRCIHSELLT